MALDDLNPFDLFDAEAERLDRHFAGLDGDAWTRPSRCEGWTVRDVLAHLAGEEAYNHACLDDDLDGFAAWLSREGVSGLADFNDWTVRTRRDRPVAEVLDEWRTRDGDTRRRMRERGRDAPLATMAGPYPTGLQTFHYCSEFATHGDDVYAPGADDPARTAWRARVGLFALEERGSQAEVSRSGDAYTVRLDGESATLTPQDFVAATVGRLPDTRELPASLREALRCLA